MKFYVEAAHPDVDLAKIESENTFILVDYLTFEQFGVNDFTCPVEYLAVFAHDEDIDYNDVMDA